MAPYSLTTLRWGEKVTRVLDAALRAVDPRQAVYASMKREGEMLRVAGKTYTLEDYQHVYVVAVGKAAVPMGMAALDILGMFITDSIFLTKKGYAQQVGTSLDRSGVQIMEAGHPIPDQRGVEATGQIATRMALAEADDLIIFLISGGGSALMTSPAAGIQLDDLQKLTSVLLSCGATITEINTIRKHLETLKGGGLAYLASPATLVSLVLSDVIHDSIDMIASGPTVPDTTTFQDAYDVIKKFQIQKQIPLSICTRLEAGMKGEVPETPKPGESFFEKNQYIIVGSNRLAAEAGMRQARKEDFNPLLLTTSLQGEAHMAGQLIGAIAQEIVATGNPLQRPACIILGGETTVTIHGTGTGGRNQELALGAVDMLSGLKEVALVTLATDGGDGPTDAAGAVVTGETKTRALAQNISPSEFLRNNDSYHFFKYLQDLLITGPTQTNVNDLTFLFVA